MKIVHATPDICQASWLVQYSAGDYYWPSFVNKSQDSSDQLQWNIIFSLSAWQSWFCCLLITGLKINKTCHHKHQVVQRRFWCQITSHGSSFLFKANISIQHWLFNFALTIANYSIYSMPIILFKTIYSNNDNFSIKYQIFYWTQIILFSAN